MTEGANGAHVPEGHACSASHVRMWKSGSHLSSPSLQVVSVGSDVSASPHESEPKVGSSQPSSSELPALTSHVLPWSVLSAFVSVSALKTLLPT